MRLNDLINQELGRYRVEALLGRGGMAAVYRAFDTRLHRHVALKVLYPQYLADDDIVERFRREAITAAQLDHPNIAPIYDVGEADGLIYLAMKLLPGPSLADVLNREHALAPERVVNIAYELAAALDEAHRRGIIHRDIKPGNVLFDDRGRAILTDFGIAKSLDAPALTETSVIVGTPDYIAPEQIDPRLAPNGKLDYRADLYSLGALLYRALTGRRPFDGPAQTVLLAHLRDDPPPPSSVRPELPAGIDAVIARAMAKQPEQRYSSALDLANDLAGSLDDQTAVGTVFPPTAIRRDVHTRPTTQVINQAVASEAIGESDPSPSPAPGRRRIPVIVALIALIVLAFSAGGYVLANRPTNTVAAEVSTTIAPAETATKTAMPTPSSSPTLEPTTTTAPTITSTPEPSATATTQVIAIGQPATSAPASQPRPSTVPVQRPTSAPIQQPTVRPTEQPTAPPTVAPTNTPQPQCAVTLVGGFGNLWRNDTGLQRSLGCPTSPEQAFEAAEQLFQGGAMYWRGGVNHYWVFSANTGTWRRYTDITVNDPEPADPAPDGLFTPVSGFGRLWQKFPDARAALGWGITPEAGFTGVAQPFDGGMMLYSAPVNGHGKRIYVLYNNGTYDVFADTYTGP